ncbi:MAG: UDP-glucose/GDP-mannose dehydrogenase family protein [Candidatus Peribacteraceae bacterium]|nr:UDP-glucose/GDP-mannose dehydrogenase family protein [Candidatus Peribacteraceae bacterium]
MKLVVVGTGYVGLVCAAVFAETGCEVVGVDTDAAKVARLSGGDCPIHEPDLPELLTAGLADGSLSFTTDLADALRDAHVVMSAVPTPTGADGAADLTAVRAVAKRVAELAEADLVFVNKSTVPMGSAAECQTIVDEALAARGKPCRVVVTSNPEFLQEGSAVRNARQPDRIVIGIDEGEDKMLAAERLAALYRPFIGEGIPVALMDRESAEVVKYASNAFLATKISFINMMSTLCEKVGADVRQVAAAMGQDPRIGPAFLRAGVGYGGSCFPKDVRALVATGRELGLDMAIAAAAQQVNDAQRERFFQAVLAGLSPAATVAVWGLAFKPETDDVRESPALELAAKLVAAGHRVRAFDPAAKPALPGAELCANALEAATGADALVLMTEWAEFRGADLAAVRKLMRGDRLFDGRNAYEPETAKQAGFAYRGVGV